MEPEGTRDHDASLFELEVRQLPGVVWVALEEFPDRISVQVITVDPLTSEATVSRIERLAERHYEVPVAIELVTSGAPSLPLVLEDLVARMHGVINATAVRGSRGELVSLTVSVRDPDVRPAVVAAIERELGCPLAPERLIVTTVAADPAATEEPRPDHLDVWNRSP